MADDTMERKTLIGFVAAMAVLVLASAAAIASVRGYGNSARWVEHTYEVIGELDAVAATPCEKRNSSASSPSFSLSRRTFRRSWVFQGWYTVTNRMGFEVWLGAFAPISRMIWPFRSVTSAAVLAHTVSLW